MIRVSTVRLLILLVQVSTASALLCLSCKGVSDIRDCLTLEECGAHQKCYSNQVLDSNGKTKYNLGCLDNLACNQAIPGKRDANTEYSAKSQSDLDAGRSENGEFKRSDPTCLECCNNLNGCNKGLCGANSTTNLRCLICRDVLQTKYCDKFTECGQDQYCFVQRTLNTASMTNRYEMDCMGFQQCNALEKASRQDCTVCCNSTDYCNYDACVNWTSTNGSVSAPPTPTSASQSTTPIPSTTAPFSTTKTAPFSTMKTTPFSTTKTTPFSTTKVTTSNPGSSAPVPVSTTPPFQVVLDGPNNSSYGSRVELKCVTLPTAQKYAWHYNGTLTLPKGVVVEKEHLLLGATAGFDILVITELNESTVGMYSCIATINGYRIEKSHAVAIRKEKPTAHITKTLIPPYFALVCNTTGYPRPQMGWAFVKSGSNTGSVDLPADADVTLKGSVSIVVVANYRPVDHDGSWYCAATNSLGNVITEVDIP